MPNINQVYPIVNELYAQATGRKAAATYDAAGLVSIGKNVLSSATNKENFCGVLVDRINKLVISERPYVGRGKNMKMDPLVWGGIVQKLDVDPIEAKEAAHWAVPSGTTTDIDIVKPGLVQRFFSGIDAFQLNVAIPDQQLEMAFTSAEEMLKLFTAIYTKLSNAKEKALENLANVTRATAIANRLMYQKDPEAVRTGTGNAAKTLVVDLRNEYNTFFGLTSGDTGYLATAADANRSPEFLRFCVQKISEYTKYFQEYGCLHNQPLVSGTTTGSDIAEKNLDRHTPSDVLRLDIISNFVSAYNSICQSDTFNSELTALPMYESVPYWQAPGVGHADARKIIIKANVNYTQGGDEKTYSFNQDGIIAVMSDYEAMGVMLNKERRRSVYDANHEVTCIYEKADKGYFVDPTENLVVFVVADSIATPTIVS
jgi:hypothetical protein